MSDEIDQLRAKRATLTEQLKRVDSALSEVEQLTLKATEIAREALGGSALQAAEGDAPDWSGHPAPSLTQGIIANERARAKRGPKGSSPDEIAGAAARVIRDQGRPMTRFELIEPIEALGLTIGGYDKPRNIGTILWRSKKFRSTGDGYWFDPEGNDPPVPSDYDEPDFDPVATGREMFYGR